jgi:hypothetical protein
LLIADEITLPNGAKLAWETKLQDMLPEWKLKDEYTSSLVDFIEILCEFCVCSESYHYLCLPSYADPAFPDMTRP